MNHIEIKNLTKTYGSVKVVNSISLEIKKGEMISLLGPSGCGKTTLLRMIAGFETITAGEIMINGRVINKVQPQERNVGIVFQDYAVFPTMTVFNNVAYGLKIKGMSKNSIHDEVMKYLDLVGLSGYETRMPSQLSGGQQQRVALARALVTKPDVLLLDEPLSNLDAALRLKIRKEIRKIQQKLGITAVFVTHDQEEALSVSDRIFVMRRGEIMQSGTPATIYKSPENDFVASFIGRSNVLYGKVDGWENGSVKVLVNGHHFFADADKSLYTAGEDVWVSIRPQKISFHDSGETVNRSSGIIQYVEYLGAVTKGEIGLDNGIALDFELYSSDSNEIMLLDRQKINISVLPPDIQIGKKIAGLE